MDTVKPGKLIKRRDALKILAATGAGLVTATLLPGKWDKPGMQMGVLPVHAQSSGGTAVLTLVSEGACGTYPGLACGDFNYVGRLSYTPTNLVPTQVSVVACGSTISSGFLAGDPGTIFVLVNIEDLQCTGARRITVTFEGGWLGVWESNHTGALKSGSLFR